MAFSGSHWASLSPTARLSVAGAPSHPAAKSDRTLLASALLLNILGLALPLATLQIYDRVVPNQSFETLTVLIIGLLGVAVVEFMLRAFQMMIAAPLAAQYTRDLKLAGLSRVLATPTGAAAAVRTPMETIERLNAIERYCSYFGGPARLALIDLPFAALSLGVIALIGGPVVFAPLAVLALYFAALGFTGARLKELSRDREEKDVKTIDFLHELFSSILTIKSYALEAMMLRRYERLLSASGETQRRIVRATSATQRFSGLFGNLSIVVTLAAGAAMAIEGEMTIGAVAACSLLAGRAAQPAIRMAKAWTEVQRASIAAESVGELFRGTRDGVDWTADANEKPAPPRLRIGPDSFRPSGSEGGVVLVTGEDASERTRVMERLGGLREDHVDGDRHLEVGGVSPATFKRRSARATVFVGSQGGWFRGSIIDNLTLFGRLGGAKEAIAVAHSLGLEAQIKQLPHGFDTEIGVSVSEMLSLNSVKRMSLARALLAKPALLVLDEPTEHLEQESDALLVTLRRLSREATIVVSGTDPRLIGIADQRIDLRRPGTPPREASP